MAKYLISGNYMGDGVSGLMDEGAASRREAVEQLVASVGGSIEALYYAIGDADIFVIADLPDNASATAISLVVNATGMVNISTTVLMTVEEMDEAIKKTPSYRPPGD